MSALADLLAGLSADAHARGKQFEVICKWFLSEAPYYRPHIAKVWLWDDWPGRWAADAGIDLVAETHGGELWAVQAKAYDEAYSVRKSDIDTFLSESARPVFAYRLLIATTDRVGTRAAATLDGQAIPVGLVLRAHLESHPVAWPTSIDVLTPSPPRERKLPRAASAAAVRAIEAGFQTYERGQVNMACGTGKTLVGLWAAEAMTCDSVLVLVPSLSLVSQALREWTDNWATERAVLAICSDDSVAQDAAMSRSRDLGIPVTTDADVAADFLARPGQKVTFATYQSSDVIAVASAQTSHRFDLCIADEAHRCAGGSSGPFGQVLDDTRVPAARRLFMTATPRLLSERLQAEASAAGLEVASMSDESKFGPVFFRLTFGEAVDQGLLTDYRVVVSGIGDLEFRHAVDARTLWQHEAVHGGAPVAADAVVAVATVAKAIEKYSLRRVVTFHTRVKEARTFAAELSTVNAWLPLSNVPYAGHVNGEMTAGRRLQALRMLELGTVERPAVVTNARCLTEGVDIPTLDGIAFVDPRESQIDIVQAVGRVMRKSDEKAHGTIVLPLVLDMDALDAGQPFDPKRFAHVWRVIRALRAHDDVLAEELDELRRGFGRRGAGGARLPGRIIIDLPTQLDPEIFASLVLRIVEATTDDWHFYFGRLEAHIEAGGSAAPETSLVLPDGTAIGRWVTAQRALKRRGGLRSERVRALEDLPGWVWDELEDRWHKAFAVMSNWVVETGSAEVPGRASHMDFALGPWVTRQRRAKATGRLPQDRVQALESLPGWVWDSTEERWLQGHAVLLRWVAQNGTADVRNQHVQNGYPLGRWVEAQRLSYKRGQLTPTAVASLEALPGWSWDTKADKFAGMLDRLRNYQAREGDTFAPANHVEDGRPLGYWLSRCRREYARGTLSAPHIAALETIPTWAWTSPRQKVQAGVLTITALWRENYEAARIFVEREGHARVPISHVEGGARLGPWAAATRKEYRRGGLHPEAVRLMEALPGWSWDPVADRWFKGYKLLLEFIEANGHGRPVTAEHPVLAEWMKRQRSDRRAGRLSAERVELLNSVPEWDWGAERPFSVRASGFG